ncbi:hypothetical protein BDY21DRAFT_70009 [Lineolata rhizophorae]|uniref:Secreted protein n=1 Tax=Lineolata rhizophorae TaxID=578093 RepID=A0A6A6NVB5_9PEZI|nr:hypothetical protein BDY21DRAFT_70009 [Lineolata rhizophorae]
MVFFSFFRFLRLFLLELFALRLFVRHPLSGRDGTGSRLPGRRSHPNWQCEMRERRMTGSGPQLAEPSYCLRWVPCFSLSLWAKCAAVSRTLWAILLFCSN